MYYPETVRLLQRAVEQAFPKAIPEKEEYGKSHKNIKKGKPATPGYILWMLDEVRRYDCHKNADARRAAQELFWVAAHVELLTSLSNLETRHAVRVDRKNGFDKAH